MKGGSSRSSPKYFRSRAHGKPSSTVLVRTRLAKSYSRLLPAEVAYFPTKRSTLAGWSTVNTVLPGAGQRNVAYLEEVFCVCFGEWSIHSHAALSRRTTEGGS